MEWNPSKTATLGMEWFPRIQGATALDANNKVVGSSFDQSASVAIGTIQVPNVGIMQSGGIYAVEVYDNETAVPVDAPSVLLAVPNEDVADGTWLNQAGNATNLFASIDDGSVSNSTDYIRVNGTKSRAVQRFNTGSLSLTGKRILSVRMRVWGTVSVTAQMSFGLTLNSVDYPGVTGLVGTQNFFQVSTEWTYNPNTAKPWTIADVQALDTTNTFWIEGGSNGPLTATDIHNVTLEVTVQTDNRLAVGTLDDTNRVSPLTAGTPTNPAWNTATMLTPTGAAWTKDGTGRHLYTVRRITSRSGSMSIPYLDAGGSVYAPNGRSWDMVADSTYSFVTSMGAAPTTKLYAFNQRTAGPADHVDSEPYCQLINATVFTGRTAEQEFTGAAASYGVLRFLVAPSSASSTLDIKVKRRSDNVQFGTTVSLTSTQVNALPVSNGWMLVQVQLGTPATLVAATQYFIEFSSATPSTLPWQVAAPSSNGVAQVATFDGTTDAATINGARNTSADLAATIATVPTAPASLTTALGSQTVGETVNCVLAMPRADLSWSVTSLGAAFGRYEIQRSEDGGTTWTDIAWVTVESVAAWKDYEALRGVPVTYRIRVVRSDNAVSVYTNGSASVTKPLLAGTGAYAATMFLTTNYNPTQNLAYEYRPGKDYKFGEAAEQTREGAYMRDYVLAANPLENRGVNAAWTFIIGADDKVAGLSGGSWEAWDSLRALARSVIPYVCALDHRGNRMFCALSVPEGTENSTGGADLYLAQVIADQVTAVPFVVTVTA